MEIRRIEREDAQAFIELSHQIEEERPYKLFHEGEQITAPQEQEEQIEWFQQSPNRALFVAEDQGRLVGYVMLMGGEYTVDRATVIMVLEVLASHHRRGIGRSLLTETERWARDHGIHRLELGVLTDNTAAIALYTSFGFTLEGTKKQARFIGSTYRDEHIYGKMIE